MTTDFDNVLGGLQRVQLLRPLADPEADPHQDPPQRGDPRQHPLLQHPPARRRLAADDGVKLTHIVPHARLAALKSNIYSNIYDADENLHLVNVSYVIQFEGAQGDVSSQVDGKLFIAQRRQRQFGGTHTL